MKRDTKVLGVFGMTAVVLFMALWRWSPGPQPRPVMTPLPRSHAPAWRPATMEEMQAQLVQEAREQKALLEQQNELLKDAAFEREFGYRRRLVPLSELR